MLNKVAFTGIPIVNVKGELWVVSLGTGEIYSGQLADILGREPVFKVLHFRICDSTLKAFFLENKINECSCGSSVDFPSEDGCAYSAKELKRILLSSFYSGN